MAIYLALMLKINYIATHLTSSVHAEQGNHIFEVFNDNDIIQCIYYSIFYVDILRGGIVTSVMTLRINNLPYLMSLLLQEFSSLKAINRKAMRERQREREREERERERERVTKER